MMQPTTNDDSLKSSIGASAALHIVGLLLLYFGLPHLMEPLPSHHDPVPFEIVELAELTNTRTDQQPEQQKQPPAPPPPPAAKAAPTPPQPSQPKVVEKVDAVALPKPTQKPKPPEQAKPKNDDFSKLLKDVTKLKPQPQAKPTETKPDEKQQQQQETKSAAPTLSDRLTITEEDLLRRQISQCWNMPIGAKDAQNLIVHVSIDVNPDRTVQHAEIVDTARMATDSYFRAAAESALRALKSPKCTPLELPVDKYEQWKHIDFTFDPRDML